MTSSAISPPYSIALVLGSGMRGALSKGIITLSVGLGFVAELSVLIPGWNLKGGGVAYHRYYRFVELFHWPGRWLLTELGCDDNQIATQVVAFGWLQFSALVWLAIVIYKWSHPMQPEKHRGKP